MTTLRLDIYRSLICADQSAAKVARRNVQHSGNTLRRAVLRKNPRVRSPSDDALGQSWERWFSLFPDAKSFFLVPIVHEKDLLAVFYAHYVRSNEQGWTSEELKVAEAIKRVVCVALQKERT